MSTIIRTGYLAETPTLRDGDKGPYTFARILVSDRIRQSDGSYVDGPVIGYDVAVTGNQAVNLVAAAEASGNIRITFSGRYRVEEYESGSGTRLVHRVQADEVAVSLRLQTVRVEKASGKGATQDDDTPF